MENEAFISPDSDVTNSSETRVIKKSKIFIEPNEKRLLIYCILCCLLTVANSVVVIIQLQSSYGQCVVGMNINEGGISIEGVESYICRCPLYSVMISSLFSWISIMVNFVSDLKTKKIIFAQWTKYQFILSLFGFLLNVVGLSLGSYGLTNWCSRLNDYNIWSSYYPHSRYSKPDTSTCWNSAKSFDKEFNLKDEQFVQQLNIFYYASSILALEAILIICWFMISHTSFKIWKNQNILLKRSRAIDYSTNTPIESMANNSLDRIQSRGIPTHNDNPNNNSQNEINDIENEEKHEINDSMQNEISEDLVYQNDDSDDCLLNLNN